MITGDNVDLTLTATNTLLTGKLHVADSSHEIYTSGTNALERH